MLAVARAVAQAHGAAHGVHYRALVVEDMIKEP
jgi:hypothetical protein